MNDNNDGPREDTFLGSAKNLEEHLAFMKSLRARGGNEKPSNMPPKSDGHSAVPPNKREESIKGVSPLLIVIVLLMSALLVAVVSYGQKDKGVERPKQIEVTKNDQVEVHVPGMRRAEQNISVQEKVTHQSNSNADQSSESRSAQVPAQASLPSNCERLTDLSAGKGYMLPRGECFLMGYTPNYVYIGAESPFTEITGADFIITTNDQSASCDSRRSPDRCTSWIGQNQKLGGEDARLHKPRFWMLFQPFGDVFIHSSQSIINPCARITNLSEGKEYLLSSGGCFAMAASPNKISIAAETEITSIEGGDFVLMSIDRTTSCDSRQAADRCKSWIKNQPLGIEDPILHKRRYWIFVTPVDEIRIYTQAR